MDKLDTYPMSKDVISVGYSTHKKIVDKLEEQIRLRDEKIINVNKRSMILNKALYKSIDLLKETGLCVNSTSLKEVKLCKKYKSCNDCWLDAILEDVKDD